MARRPCLTRGLAQALQATLPSKIPSRIDVYCTISLMLYGILGVKPFTILFRHQLLLLCADMKVVRHELLLVFILCTCLEVLLQLSLA